METLLEKIQQLELKNKELEEKLYLTCYYSFFKITII